MVGGGGGGRGPPESIAFCTCLAFLIALMKFSCFSLQLFFLPVGCSRKANNKNKSMLSTDSPRLT